MVVKLNKGNALKKSNTTESIEYVQNESNITVINAIGYEYNEDLHIYQSLIDDFNQFSKETNLNITIYLNLFTRHNATLENKSGFLYTQETYLKKKSNLYDIYFYDSVYTPQLGSYFIDLSQYLSKEHINIYNEKIIFEVCYLNNKLVGLPVTLDFSVLFSNTSILNKYNKKIPTTWDELLNTTKYIKEQEKILNNNNDLIIYNGLFPENEVGTCSLYEFIYSYRNSENSTFPVVRSQETVNALEMIKTLKDEVSSDQTFLNVDELIYENLFSNNENALFLKYWKTIPEVLNEIEDLKKIYYFSISTDKSLLGLIIFIIIIIILIVMISSTSLLFIKRFYPFISFLPRDFWFLIILGSIILMFRALTEYGKVSLILCHSKPLLLSIGITFNLVPILYKLIEYLNKPMNGNGGNGGNGTLNMFNFKNNDDDENINNNSFTILDNNNNKQIKSLK
ncbi:hypothetical protein BCR32DRAFT_249347 [Anaeromyces robustus]|uniref:Periplasmic binding protein-like II n=1 Tax=Anaeromyces robustus TaxID=1754192 RepID=A0A1Y1WR03_9FUNG|nr:hypothetical protein BCR32DRAFT_249347 [Anaeromyces robustus]|eukprot:ORX75706.1 hypothetical protein BCR32DRAFT_249347 [Anaeromyces robustus]